MWVWWKWPYTVWDVFITVVGSDKSNTGAHIEMTWIFLSLFQNLYMCRHVFLRKPPQGNSSICCFVLFKGKTASQIPPHVSTGTGTALYRFIRDTIMSARGRNTQGDTERKTDDVSTVSICVLGHGSWFGPLFHCYLSCNTRVTCQVRW